VKRCLALAVFAAALPAVASAQNMFEPPQPTPIQIHPAAEPVPALKYRLLPDQRALVRGNAAVFYHRAIQMIIEGRHWRPTQTQTERGIQPVTEEKIYAWLNAPLRALPREEIRAYLDLRSNPLKEAALGARRTYCDWEFDQRSEGIELLMSEIQEMRALARLVVLRIRLAILDGRADDAVYWLQTGFAMSHHVAAGPTLIQALVGTATGHSMTKCLDELIQVPGCPNLYWALAALPRPFVNMTPIIEADRYLMERSLHLEDIDRGIWSAAEARQFSEALYAKLKAYTSDRPYGATGSDRDDAAPTIQRAALRLTLAAIAAKVYPEAKRALLAQGRPASDIEAMPAMQVIWIYTIQEYERITDDYFKWCLVPLTLSADRAEQALGRRHTDRARSNPLLAMLTDLLAAVTASRIAGVRLDRQLDCLQCIEAVRIYAAAHNGTLPASLDAITEVPVPQDPGTGKPFEYARGPSSALLGAPVPIGAPVHQTYFIRYELKPAPPTR
jgi:hypothetical protein